MASSAAVESLISSHTTAGVKQPGRREELGFEEALAGSMDGRRAPKKLESAFSKPRDAVEKNPTRDFAQEQGRAKPKAKIAATEESAAAVVTPQAQPVKDAPPTTAQNGEAGVEGVSADVVEAGKATPTEVAAPVETPADAAPLASLLEMLQELQAMLQGFLGVQNAAPVQATQGVEVADEKAQLSELLRQIANLLSQVMKVMAEQKTPTSANADAVLTPAFLPADAEAQATALPVVPGNAEFEAMLAKIKSVLAFTSDSPELKEALKAQPEVSNSRALEALQTQLQRAMDALKKVQVAQQANAASTTPVDAKETVAAEVIVPVVAAAAQPKSTQPLQAEVARPQTAETARAVQNEGGQDAMAFTANDNPQENFAGEKPENDNAPVMSTHSRHETAAFAKLLEAQPSKNIPVPEQVAAQVKSAIKNGVNHIQIKLNPVELGSLDIRMVIGKDGATKVDITAESSRTLAVLQSEAKTLEKLLLDVGLKADAGALNFSLSGEGKHNPESQNPKFAYGSAPLEAVQEEEVLPQYYTVVSADGVDIRI